MIKDVSGTTRWGFLRSVWPVGGRLFRKTEAPEAAKESANPLQGQIGDSVLYHPLPGFASGERY